MIDESSEERRLQDYSHQDPDRESFRVHEAQSDPLHPSRQHTREAAALALESGSASPASFRMPGSGEYIIRTLDDSQACSRASTNND